MWSLIATIFIVAALALSITAIVLATQTNNKLNSDTENQNKSLISSDDNNSVNGDKEKEGELVRSSNNNNNNTFNIDKLRKSKRTPVGLKTKQSESESILIFISNLLEHYGIENYLTHKHVNDQNVIEFSEKDYEIGFTVHSRDFETVAFDLRSELESKYNFTCSHIFPKTKQFFKDLEPTHRNAHYSKYAEFYSQEQIRLRFYFTDSLQPCTKTPQNIHIPQQFQSWII